MEKTRSDLANYIAYHSAEKMGREYRPIQKRVGFMSRKPESLLRGAIGSRVWVISSTKKKSRHTYRFEGMFTPSEVSWEGDHFLISGSATPFRARPDITARSWFGDLLREQNNFSFGFNWVRNEGSIVEMQRLLDGKEI